MNNVALGLRENRSQFILLVLVNAFVGGMAGLERSILPEIAESEFQLAQHTAVLSFIIVFGIVKALTNLFTGTLAGRAGRKNLLVAGWILGLPVPFILMYAGNWNWIIFANVLLGINQGLAWSSTVMMKIDLVGEKQRGLAMGLNEFAGYLAVAGVAFATASVAHTFGLRPYPFYIGIALAAAGLLVSITLVKDTRAHVAHETTLSKVPRLPNVFWQTTWANRNLGSVTQAGLVNNLNDGMAWGLLPIFLASKGFTLAQIGIVAGVYPAVWGLGQLLTGRLSDFFCKKSMLWWGMLLQALALIAMVWAQTMLHFVSLAVLLGWGTAMVYPTFLASVAENTHPLDRARSLGVFRFWRDLGYALGAALTGLLADHFALEIAVLAIGGLTLASAFVIELRMRCHTDHIKIAAWLRLKLAALLRRSGISFTNQKNNTDENSFRTTRRAACK